MKNLILKILFPILIITTFSGCWNRREINHLGIIGALGYDLEGEKIRITAEVLKSYKPKGGGGGASGGSEAIYASALGDTFLDTSRNVTASFDRKLFHPHLAAYFLGQDLAAKGIGQLLDFTMRDHELRLSPYMIVVKGEKASKVFGASTGIEEMLLGYIIGLNRSQKATSKSVFVDVKDFLNDYYSDGKHPVASVIELKQEPQGDTMIKGEGAQNKDKLVHEGLAIFNRDMFKGYLNGDETLAYNFVTNHISSTIITTPSPDKKGLNSVEVVSAKTKNKVSLSGNSASIKIKVDIKGVIGEEGGQSNIDKIDIIKMVEKTSSDKIKQSIELTIKKVQKEYCIDIFGFGNEMHRTNPKQWKIVKSYWDSIFANAQIDISVSTDITRTGDTLKPIKNREVY